MSNIVRRGNGGQQLTSQNEWSPFRAMRELLRWDPFQEMLPIAQAGWPTVTYAPDFEVKETKDGFQFKADLPGIKEKDLEVTCTGNRLTVSGKREAEQQEKTDTYFVYERSYGSFTRSFTLPDGVDAEHIKAELKDGVLSLVVPKKAEQMPKNITVQASEKPKS
jgi:HSP20 family protein